MSAAQDLLKAFAADRQVAGFAEDADGRAGLKVGEGATPIDLKADGDRLYVYGSLGPVPLKHEQAVLTMLLAANRAGAIGEGPVMSVDPNLGDIVLSQELDARTASSATLLRTIGWVAEQVEAWQRRLAEVDAAMAQEPADEGTVQLMAHYINRA